MNTLYIILGIVGYIVMWFVTSLLFLRIETDEFSKNTMEDYVWISLFGSVWPILFPFLGVAALLKHFDK